MSKTKQILRLHAEGSTIRSMAEKLSASRNTVRRVLRALEEHPLDLNSLDGMTNREVEAILFPERYAKRSIRQPDFAAVHQELKRPGVTLRLLWEEYQRDCTIAGEDSYGYSRFCALYQEYSGKKNLTAPLIHKPGEEVMVDWAGTKVYLNDPDSAKKTGYYLFVAVLPYSMYAFVAVMPSMAEADWVRAHQLMFSFFGGVPQTLICDNCKTAVLSNPKGEAPVLNPVYREMADHYGTTIIPARTYRPRDKAAVESTVNNATTFVAGALRNAVLPTPDLLQAAVSAQLADFNSAPFQKREGSRLQVFLEEEREWLRPLPADPFVLSQWSTAVVQSNCHICLQKHNYSVPFQYVGCRVDVQIKEDKLNIFYEGKLLCSHDYLGKKGGYSTVQAHMPTGHQKYNGRWTGKSLRGWAKTFGPFTGIVVDRMLSAANVEQQAYKAVLGVLNLPKKYRDASLEAVCEEIVVVKNCSPTLHLIEELMKQNVQVQTKIKTPAGELKACGRGSEYYASKVTGKGEHNV